jgi:ApbE superfamily uncharacterized protein (UPF0280 family)
VERAGWETRETADLEVCATAGCRVSLRLGSIDAARVIAPRYLISPAMAALANKPDELRV